MVTVEIDKKAVARVQAKIGGLASPESRLQFFDWLGDAVLRWVDRNFRTGGGLVGGWRPLAPLTLFGKLAGASLPLETLRQWFTSQPTENDVRVGTNRPVAKYHQYGTGLAAGGRKYPIRPRNKKALAFPAPPSWIQSAKVGEYLQVRERGTPRVGLVTKSNMGTKPYTGLAKAVMQAGRLQSFAVMRGVMHPGVAVRRMLPNAEEAAAIVRTTAADWFRSRTASPGQKAEGKSAEEGVK